MGDIINIVVHPGYNINKDGYNKDIYLEQLDKGKLNIFLHPQISDFEKKHFINKYYNEFLIEIKNAKTVPEIRDYISKHHTEHFMMFHYSAYKIRNFIFNIIRRAYKRKGIKSKAYSKRIYKITKIKKKTIIDIILKNNFPVFNNHCDSEENIKFKNFLLEKYNKDSDEQFNLHIDAVFLNQFDAIMKSMKLDCFEENDKIYLFGEHYNQCVNNTSKILDNLEINYTLLPELSSFNYTCEKTKETFKEDNNHFLIIK